MIERLFFTHPVEVGETYSEHLRTACWFAGTMFVAALACFVHALVPGLFVKTGSNAICRLHDRMVVSRCRAVHGADRPSAAADA